MFTDRSKAAEPLPDSGIIVDDKNRGLDFSLDVYSHHGRYSYLGAHTKECIRRVNTLLQHRLYYSASIVHSLGCQKKGDNCPAQDNWASADYDPLQGLNDPFGNASPLLG